MFLYVSVYVQSRYFNDHIMSGCKLSQSHILYGFRNLSSFLYPVTSYCWCVVFIFIYCKMFSMMHAWQKCCKWMPISRQQTFLTCSDQLYMRHNWVSISFSSAERMIKLLAKLSWLCELVFLCAWWSDKRYTAHDVYYSSVSGQTWP